MTIQNSNFPSQRPTLLLDFARTRLLDPRITFSRSAAGTYIDAKGILQTAAAGVARFDHNPSTGESLGLLVEEARTNLIRRSDQYWDVFLRSTIYGQDADGFYNVLIDGQVRLYQYNVGTAPDGLPATRLKVPAGSGSTGMRTPFDINFAGATVYTLSFWFRNSLSNPLTANCNVSLVNTGAGGKASTTVAVASTSNRTVWSNGWERVWITFNSTTGDGNFLKFDWFRTASDQIFEVAGFQLEAGSFPTSYIPTPSTFTGRTSTATFYDANGVIQTAASGVARSNAFLPDSSGVFRPVGLLLEVAATNLLNGSQTFATTGGTQNNWVDTNITRDGTLRTSPDGTANALRVTAAAADATIISSAAIGTSASRTFSIFLRRVTGTGNIQYTLDNGTTWTTQAITGSWVRYSFPATTADQQVGIRIVTSGNAIELWGAQLETGSFATSYIPTTTATVTRAADTSTSATATRSADVALVSGSAFSGFWNASTGSVQTNFFSRVSGTRPVASFDDNTANNKIEIYTSTSNSKLTITTAGVSQADLTAGTASGSSINRQAISYSVNDFAAVLGGGAAATDASGSVPVVSQLRLGADQAGNIANAAIAKFSYWPTKLSQAILQTVTR